MDKKRTKTLEELMQTDEVQEEGLKEEIREEEKEARKSKTKLWLIAIAVLVALILIGGGYTVWRVYQANQNLKNEDKTDTIPTAKAPETTTQKTVSVNSDVGLNLRKEALATAELITTIPNNTILTVLEEKDDWYKVEYNNQTGWVAKEYTIEKTPTE